MFKRPLVPFFVFILAFTIAMAAPATAQEESPLVVKAEHIIQLNRAGPDSDVGVIENLRLENRGDEPFDGEVWVDLHPAAQIQFHYWHNGTGHPYPGDPGRPSDQAVSTQNVGDHTRHILDLAERGLTLAPAETVILVLQYMIPSDEDSFTRGFTLETPALNVLMGDPPGLRPVSEQNPMEPTRDPRTGAWVWRLAPDATGPFQAGDSFSFTWEPKEEPLEPLMVDIQVSGQDPLELTAVASGGIADYEYTWDLIGDGQCDDAQGRTVEVPAAMQEGLHRITVCVIDSSVPPREATTTFQARTTFEEGAWEGPSPWLLLVIGILGGGFLVFALTQGGFVPAGKTRAAPAKASLGAESREMLETRQRVMIAALKELEIAKKKGEVPESQYTSLKSELKKDTVAVMRELERRKSEKETV